MVFVGADCKGWTKTSEGCLLNLLCFQHLWKQDRGFTFHCTDGKLKGSV